MAQLEQRLRESELQVHGALLGRGTSFGDMCMLRLQVSENKLSFPLTTIATLFFFSLKKISFHTVVLQEAQRENAFLRAQFTERTDCVALEKAEAERRLGAVEAETRRLTESLKEACERHAEEMKKQEERVCAYLTPLPNPTVASRATTL